ncbi:efflux RND transporter permease subunit [Thermococcus nautili]|uniref:Putative exporters of the RND superfamily n=1 Tax=Thermococcus nautili TaxID=195522 RepID=W8P447_9EURY|nr:MMPL family transporter [Thermococcus nautili]AHL23586.1 putative exporters of the RND superfamily [Thermococcus nautili]
MGFADLVVEKPKRTIAVILLVTLVFMAFASQLKEETSLNALFPNYPEVKALEKIQRDFGNVEPVVVVFRGSNVLTPEYFSKTAELTEKIMDGSAGEFLIEPKENAVTSLPAVLASYRLAKEGVSPTPDRVLEEMRSFKTAAEIRETLREFLSDPSVPEQMKDYALSLLPRDFNRERMESPSMAIYVLLNASYPEDELEKAELEIEGDALSVDNDSLTYGFHLMNYYYVKTEERLAPAFLLALVLILALMYLNFRSLGDVAISLITLFLAVVWTFGLAGALGWKLDLMAGMVPILVLGLGIDFSFHVLMGYREKLNLGPKDAMKAVLSTVGVALLLAMVTTVVGFSSNAISSLPSMRRFGFLSAFAILSVFVLNVTFVPALKVLRPSAPPARRKGRARLAIGALSDKRFAGLLVISAFLVAAVGWSLGLGMKASYNPTGELAKDLRVTKAYELLNSKFDIGTERVYVRVDGNLTDPALWRRLQIAVQRMADDRYVVKSGGKPAVEWLLSALPIIAAENPGVSKAYALVDRNGDGWIDSNVTPRELEEFLKEAYETRTGRFYLHESNGHFDGLLLVVPSRTDFGYHGKELLRELREDFRGLNATITGDPIIWAKGLDDMRNAMILSILLCLAFTLTVLPVSFAVAHRAPLEGLLAALVPLAVLGWLFATMKLLNIPLNAMTAMVGAIIVGIGIDYPIHVANRWVIERRTGKGFREAYSTAVSTAGREVLYSALTTLIAFGVLVTIPIPVVTQFAATVLFGLVYSFLGAVVLLPAMVRLLR